MTESASLIAARKWAEWLHEDRIRRGIPERGISIREPKPEPRPKLTIVRPKPKPEPIQVVAQPKPPKPEPGTPQYTRVQICNWCHGEFTRFRKQLTCSKECGNALAADNRYGKPRNKRRLLVKQCVVCEKEFTPTRSTSVACSRECAAIYRWRNGHSYPDRKFTCESCSAEFTARLPNARFCGKACRARASRRQRKELVSA